MPPAGGDDALAALVAQSVAARSYALATLKPTANYDLYNDQRSQVYGGVSRRDPRTTRAVLSTRGTVLTYDARSSRVLLLHLRRSHRGRAERLPQQPRPYLVSVPDPFDRISPYHQWPDPPTFTAARLGTLLGLDGR